jgi:integrase
MSYQKIAPRLYIKTSTGGTQSWVYRYTLAKLTKEKGLGSFDGTGRAALSKAAAIKMADIYNGKIAQGIDPWGHRSRKQMTFAEVIAEIIENGKWAVEANGTCKTKQAYERLLKDAPRLARMSFAHPHIEDEVEAALKPVWGTKKGEDMQSKIYKAFEHAKARKVFQGDNPADRARIVILLGKGRDTRSVAQGGDVVHHEALPWQNVPEVIAKLAAKQDVAAAGTRFLILTTARSANVQYCKKSAIDRQARTWTVKGDGAHTGDRMKAGVDHTYYLSDEAMEIVNALWDRPGDYLFPGTKPGQPVSHSAFREKLGPKARGGIDVKEATPHGFRSTFGNWVMRNHAEKKPVADAMLAHADGKVQSAYFREDAVETMRFLAAAWGRHCMGTNVVPFKREVA